MRTRTSMPALPQSTESIRVAHVIQNLNYGGMERVLHNLARELPRRGFEFHVVVLEFFGRFADGLDSPVTLHQVPPMSRFSLFHPGELTAVLRRINPDIVHSHTGVWTKAALASRGAGVPVMLHTEHGRPVPDRLSDRLIDGFASRCTDGVIAVSETLADFLARRIVSDPSKIRVIVNGIDVERLRPPTDRTAIRHGLRIPPDARVIGSIGRLEPVKNYQMALRAFARLPAKPGPALSPLLVLVGDGSERDLLERLATTLGIASRVMFLGWREDADRIYGAFDLFTLPSRSEGTSISLLEAMSTGVCPVVTDVGGNRSVLGPGMDSLMVPDQDEASLASAWQGFLEDHPLRTAMGIQARQRVEAVFSLERMVDRHVTVYHEFLGRSSAR